MPTKFIEFQQQYQDVEMGYSQIQKQLNDKENIAQFSNIKQLSKSE